MKALVSVLAIVSFWYGTTASAQEFEEIKAESKRRVYIQTVVDGSVREQPIEFLKPIAEPKTCTDKILDKLSAEQRKLNPALIVGGRDSRVDVMIVTKETAPAMTSVLNSTCLPTTSASKKIWVIGVPNTMLGKAVNGETEPPAPSAGNSFATKGLCEMTLAERRKLYDLSATPESDRTVIVVKAQRRDKNGLKITAIGAPDDPSKPFLTLVSSDCSNLSALSLRAIIDGANGNKAPGNPNKQYTPAPLPASDYGIADPEFQNQIPEGR